jgi:excisionase family DNA binding protein
MPETGLITTAETARLLGVSIRTVHRMAGSGKLPYAHRAPTPRGQYIFSRQVVEWFIAQQERKAS